MRILLTNDDGIGAQGLQALRRELRRIEGVRLDVIAPDSNRSASARSITTRGPLAVEEIRFDDGDLGHATDGTPVDCVRFADVGLVGERPDLIVSGINHGLNLGDDVTYSGTVAAALEGVMLGLPAIAVSQQSTGRETGYMPQRHYDFELAARITAETVRELISNPPGPGLLVNINVPGTDPEGIDVTRLGKRLYRSELEKVRREVEDGRTSYRIYGYEPGLDDEPGTDIGAIARDRISFTPLRLDWTDHDRLEGLRGRDLDRLLEAVRR